MTAAAAHAADDRWHITSWLRPVTEEESANIAAAAAAARELAKSGEHMQSVTLGQETADILCALGKGC